MNERITRRMALAGLVTALFGGSWPRRAAAGRITQTAAPLPAPGRLTSISYPEDSIVCCTYEYDGDSGRRPRSIKSMAPMSFSTCFTYDAAGKQTARGPEIP